MTKGTFNLDCCTGHMLKVSFLIEGLTGKVIVFPLKHWPYSCEYTIK